MFKRIFAGISSNLFLQGINAVIQVFGIPLCLKFWGEQYYGEWLLLFTIPGYLSVSDFGLGTSATAEMAMMEETDRRKEINPLLRSVFWFIVTWGFLLFGLLILSSYILPWYDWLKLSAIKSKEFAATFPLLILYIYFSLFLTIPLNFYRVIKKYYIERYVSSAYRLIEFLVLFVLVINGHGVLWVALGYLLLRICFFLFIVIDLYRRADNFRLWPIEIHMKEVKKVFRPGVSSLFYYLGGNILNQGISTIIGLNFGPAKLVMFTTFRTLINFSKQLFSILNLTFNSEFSYAYGAKNVSLLRQLVKTSIVFNILISGLSCLMLFFAGQWIVTWWTNGVVIVDKMFFDTYLVYAFLGSISSISINIIFATNIYKHTGIAYLALSGLCIFLNSIFVGQLGLSFISVTLIVFEIVFILLSFKIVLHLLESGWKDFWQSISFQDLLIYKIGKGLNQ